MRTLLLGALWFWGSCATAPLQLPNFALQFGVQEAPTILLIAPSWSDRGLAMLELIREAKAEHDELQVVMVVMDDLPTKAWNVAAKALKIPGVARRSQGLGLEDKPLGPIREVPVVYWITKDQRVVQRAVGFVSAEVFAEQTQRLLEGIEWSGWFEQAGWFIRSVCVPSPR